jgi:hypothetical protein
MLQHDTRHHAQPHPMIADRESVYAPGYVLNPGETFAEAEARHRRETGHQGACVCVWINTGVRQARAA